VQFESEEHDGASDAQPDQKIPTIDKMSLEWREELRQALARKNITRL
jgi:hypothetical protein